MSVKLLTLEGKGRESTLETDMAVRGLVALLTEAGRGDDADAVGLLLLGGERPGENPLVDLSIEEDISFGRRQTLLAFLASRQVCANFDKFPTQEKDRRKEKDCVLV